MPGTGGGLRVDSAFGDISFFYLPSFVTSLVRTPTISLSLQEFHKLIRKCDWSYMELVWNNPNPDRTANRPPACEVVARDGTRRVVSADEVQAMADGEIAHDVKDVANASESLLSLYFCF